VAAGGSLGYFGVHRKSLISRLPSVGKLSLMEGGDRMLAVFLHVVAVLALVL
jgi:hypothetical protein